MKLTLSFAALLSLSLASSARAQHGYEYEVYGTDISRPGSGELELHMNFVPAGTQTVDEPDGRATNRAWRSSFEVTAGVASWLEASVYAVGYARSGAGVKYVGNRARLTAIAPTRWNLPFDLGLAQEIAFARPGYSEHRWAYEVTPIISRKLGAASLTLNPALERAVNDNESLWELEPRARLAYAFDGDEGVGLEYYSVLGPVSGFDERSHQIHQVFATASGELSGDVEGGLGIGRGLTRNSDRWIITTRLEIRF